MLSEAHITPHKICISNQWSFTRVPVMERLFFKVVPCWVSQASLLSADISHGSPCRAVEGLFKIQAPTLTVEIAKVRWGPNIKRLLSTNQPAVSGTCYYCLCCAVQFLLSGTRLQEIVNRQHFIAIRTEKIKSNSKVHSFITLIKTEFYKYLIAIVMPQ
jgi:hypothetical protein